MWVCPEGLDSSFSDNGRITCPIINMLNIWYHNCVCQHGVIKIIFLSCPSPSCSKLVLLDRKEGMHNKTPCSRLLRMHLLLHCVDLCSKLHILEAGEAPWKQRGLLMAFPFSHKVFGTLRGYLLFRRICLATRFYVCMLVQCTGKVLCCHNYFFC